MEETEPVTNFMRQGLSFIIWHEGASRDARISNNNSILPWIILIVEWECRKAEGAGLFKSNSIDVESTWTAFIEGRLHVPAERIAVSNTTEPSAVGGTGNTSECKANTGAAIKTVSLVVQWISYLNLPEVLVCGRNAVLDHAHGNVSAS